MAVRVAPGLPPLVSDARLVRRVLRGLVDNAVKFTTAGEVEIRVTASRDVLRVAVSDTGPGIAVSERERIFEAFETLENIQHKHTRGLGVGLAIARASTERMNGSLELTRSDQLGSTFTATFPSLAPLIELAVS